ncbi:DUF4179 domain-containing protein [Bacillus sp. BGMRC 2118]|nr:DUF4179 domain-containing protein [Bacillus sp. BGMRC 2118]
MDCGNSLRTKVGRSMFDKEEAKLRHVKQQYDEIPIPDSIDHYIQAGIQSAKLKRKRGSIYRFSGLVAVVMLIAMLSLIRVSPTFAGYISSIPGFEKIVELVRSDKGLISAIENDFIQPIGVSDVQDGVKVTMDSVIVDNNEMVLFYTVESDRNLGDIMPGKIAIKDMETNEGFDATFSYESLQEVTTDPVSGTIEFYADEWPSSMELSLQLFSTLSDKERPVTTRFTIPFTIDVQKFEGMQSVFSINKTASIENQKFTINKMVVHPTEMELYLQFDPANDKEIFNFDDLKIVDEKGEHWNAKGSIRNENEHIVTFESNYFHEPKKLYVEFSSVRAVDKDELEVVVDVENQKILKAPSDERFLSVQRSGHDLSFLLKNENAQDQNHSYNLFGGDMVDATGATYSISSRFSSPASDDSNNVQIEGIVLPTLDFANPITLTLSDYPARLKEKVRIQIK